MSFALLHTTGGGDGGGDTDAEMGGTETELKKDRIPILLWPAYTGGDAGGDTDEEMGAAES